MLTQVKQTDNAVLRTSLISSRENKLLIISAVRPKYRLILTCVKTLQHSILWIYSPSYKMISFGVEWVRLIHTRTKTSPR